MPHSNKTAQQVRVRSRRLKAHEGCALQYAARVVQPWQVLQGARYSTLSRAGHRVVFKQEEEADRERYERLLCSSRSSAASIHNDEIPRKPRKRDNLSPTSVELGRFCCCALVLFDRHGDLNAVTTRLWTVNRYSSGNKQVVWVTRPEKQTTFLALQLIKSCGTFRSIFASSLGAGNANMWSRNDHNNANGEI